MREPIRLVIWDLDETFWKGTLTEGGIREYVQDNHNLVIELAQRGIMSSICSKNDHNQVKALLQARGIWEYFIFPSIDWSPKGPRIEAIVDAVQLRAPTIMFIDDNHANRGEARAAVPGIEVADETIITRIRDDPFFRGKSYNGLTRLKQYKLLEEKVVSKTRFNGDNREFLKQSAIRVRIVSELDDKLDRIVELINRTNQLNFTKRRIPDDVEEAKQVIVGMLKQFDARAGLVEVEDRYGKYGYCGFFLMSGHWGVNTLWHFAFSCRVLGMGVEQWVYDVLGRPKFEIVGEVLSKLDFAPDWINNIGDRDSRNEAAKPLPDVRIRGGCELEILEHFFRAEAKSTTSEVISMQRRHIVMRNHSSLLAQSTRPLSDEQIEVIQDVGLELGDMRSNFFGDCAPGSLLVFSPTADAFCPIYQHHTHALRLPVNLVNFGDPGDKSSQDIESYFSGQNFTEAERGAFHHMNSKLTSEFTRIVDDREAVLADDYRAILRHAPLDSLLVVILPNYVMIRDGNRVENHLQLQINNLFKACMEPQANIVFIDMSEMVNPETEVMRYYVHYHRNVYFRLYQRIRVEYQEWIARTEQSCDSESQSAVLA
jgi:FkbH-like protein